MRARFLQHKTLRRVKRVAESAWIDRLAEEGLLLWDHFLGPADAGRIRTELCALFAAGLGAPAQIGRGERETLAPDIRRDLIYWFDEHETRPGAAAFLAAMHVLRRELNRVAFLGLQRLECHAACYRPGAYYRAHKDAFADGSNRVISFVYFLNPDWRPEDAGELQILGAAPQRIAPLMDRLVLFKSRDILHEVLPTRTERYSLTGWIYGYDEERARRAGILGNLAVP